MDLFKHLFPFFVLVDLMYSKNNKFTFMAMLPVVGIFPKSACTFF